MIYLTSNEIKNFKDITATSKFFIIPFLSRLDVHYTKTDISFIYFYDINGLEEYVLSINHNDSDKFDLDVLDNLSERNFVVNKKYLKTSKQQYDANMLVYFNTNKMLIKEHRPPILDFYKKLYSEVDMNFVPLVKLTEYCNLLKNRFMVEYHSFKLTDSFDSYNDIILSNLEYIEQSGIKIVGDKWEHTEYSPYTLTSRPTNTFNKINYAALNKDNGERSRFVSRFKDGMLVEFDFKSYHLNLICRIIGYTFDGDIYTELSKVYFGVENPTEDQIHESKNITFKQIYGGVDEQYTHHPFFQKLSIFISNIDVDNVYTLFFARRMKFTEDVKRVKVFNYLLQNLETEINMSLIDSIKTVLSGHKTKLVLYTYDSFLFDYSTSDKGILLKKLSEIFDSVGETRLKIGSNYNNMQIKKIKE